MTARRVLLVCGGVVLLLAVVGGAFVLSVKPELHRGTPGKTGEARASPERMQGIVEELPGPRSLADPSALGVAEDIAFASLVRDGYRVYREEVRHPEGSTHRHAPAHDVLTSVPETGKVWLVAAHLDTVPGSPGADDDGSGVAVVLEAAHLLGRSEAGKHVVFALFTEEETGLLGSRQYVAEAAGRLGERLAGAIVLDAVGCYSTAEGSQRAPPPLGPVVPHTGDFLSIITLGESSELAARFVEAQGRAAPDFSLTTFAPPRWLAERLPDLWRSDHAPFWAAELPAVFLTDTGPFRNPRYHRPEDVPASLDFRRLAEVADLVADVVSR